MLRDGVLMICGMVEREQMMSMVSEREMQTQEFRAARNNMDTSNEGKRENLNRKERQGFKPSTLNP